MPEQNFFPQLVQLRDAQQQIRQVKAVFHIDLTAEFPFDRDELVSLLNSSLFLLQLAEMPLRQLAFGVRRDD